MKRRLHPSEASLKSEKKDLGSNVNVRTVLVFSREERDMYLNELADMIDCGHW